MGGGRPVSLRVAAAAALALGAAAPTAAVGGDARAVRPRAGVPVLVCHHLGEPEGPAVLAPERFDAQMRWLVERGYRAAV